MPGFKCFDIIRPFTKQRGRNSGGIAVFVQDYMFDYADITQLKSSSNNILWLLVSSKVSNFHNLLLGFVYMSPEHSSVHSNELLFDTIENELATFKNDYPDHSTFILGDFNAYTSTNPDYIVLDDSFDILNDTLYNQDIAPPPRANSDGKDVNNYGQKLLQLCISTGLRICNGRFGSDNGHGYCTCYTDGSPSLIDYILSDMSISNCFTDFTVTDRIESIHMPVSIELSFNASSNSNDTVPNHEDNTGNEYIKLKWDETKRHHFVEQMSAGLELMYDTFIDALTRNDVSSAIQNLTDCFVEAGTTMVTGLRRNRIHNTNIDSYHQPWFNHTCRNLRANVLRKLREFRLTRSDNALQDYKSIKREYRETCRASKLRHEADERAKLIAAANCKNPKFFWNHLKSHSGLKGVKIKMGEWYGYFHGLFNPNSDADFEDMTNGDFVTDDILDAHITDTEVSQAISRLKLGKAAGIDGITAEFVKAAPDRLTHVLCLLYNNLYDNGSFPENWSTSIISPILKKGNINDPSNYRGISLLPILSKIFTDILNRRFERWCNAHSVLGEEQGGFRSGYSTIDNIFSLSTLINKYLQKPHGRFYALFVDFEKAFDRINRQALFNKLCSSNVSSKFLIMIKSIYQDVKARVKSPCGITDSFDCPYGVRQGCTLSPLLFSLFINDLNDYVSEGCHGITLNLRRLFTLLYADDLVLFAETRIELQRMINRLKSYCDCWNLKINLQKTKVVVFRNGGYLRSYEKWFYGEDAIEVATYYKYLGIVFSSRFSWYMCQKTLAEQATKAIFSLKSSLCKYGQLPVSLLFKIFDTKIQPILCYGSEVWFSYVAKDVDIVHSKFCKYVLQLNWATPNMFVIGELGRHQLYCNRALKAIKYWFRILDMNGNRLPAICYKVQYQWAENNTVCWAYHIRRLLYSCGFGHVWINQGVGNIDIFCKQLSLRLRDIDVQNWHDSLAASDRLTFYNSIKSSLVRESYIDQIDNSYYRSLIIKFRGGLLALSYNTGFFTKTPIDERLCPLCGLCIEDEFHLLLICRHYDTIRRQLLPSFLVINATREKFVSVLSNCSLPLYIQIARYLHLALKIRNQIAN